MLKNIPVYYRDTYRIVTDVSQYVSYRGTEYRPSPTENYNYDPVLWCQLCKAMRMGHCITL